jgi:hypothetical protein
MRWPKFVENCTMWASVYVIFSGVVACAQFPQSLVEFGWSDRWGDRGVGVLARDYQMCTELVEHRRGLLEGCMEAKGWQH